MKQDPPHLDQARIERLVLLAWTVALFVFFVLTMAGGGGGAPLQQPLEAPRGFGL